MKNFTKKDTIESLIVIAITAIIIFLINKYACSFIKINGTSMHDNIYENDICLSFYYDLDNIKRFDIVVVDTDSEKKLVKRVIGLPGETIEYKDNKLYVNGSYVEEEFLNSDTLTKDFIVNLANDEYYCLGDNRKVSNDSRTYGPFSKDSIKSSHIFRLFPFDKIGFIE